MKNASLRTLLLTFTIHLLVPHLLALSPIQISPLSGPANTVVTLEGTDFDSQTAYTATLGDEDIDATYVSPTSLQLTIPQSASSGFITLHDGTQSSQSPNAFLLTRPITVNFDASIGFDTSSHDVGTMYSTATGNTTRTLNVDTSGPSLVMSGTEDPSTLPVYGVATTDINSLTLGAASTVEAFAFSSSYFYSADETELNKRLAHLRNQSTYATTVAALQSHYSNGTDFLASDDFSQQLESLLLEYVETYASFGNHPSSNPEPTVTTKSSTNDFTTGFEDLAEGFPRELKKPGYERLDHLIGKPHIKIPGRNGVPILKIKMDAAPVSDSGNDDLVDALLKRLTANPLDWSANVYQLDPNDHRLDSPQELANLTKASWTAYYDRVQLKELDKLIVPAQPITRYVDLFGIVKNEIKKRSLALFTESVLPKPDAVALKSDLTIPSERPGIYMIRSYSGALFPEQDQIISTLPYGEQEDFHMLALNIILLFNDSYAFIVGQSNTISSREWAKFLFGLQTSISSNLTKQAAQGTLSSEALLGIYWEVGKAVNSWIVDKGEAAAKEILGDLTKGRFGRLKSFLGKAINVSAKVATVGKVVERLAAITNAPRLLTNNARMALALEDTLVVVGDPWAPVITSFTPTSGYRGTKVTLNGEGFSPEISDNTVTFGYNSTSTDSPPQAAQAKVTYADYRGLSLNVEVPETASTGIISVDVVDAGRGNTVNNDAPHKQFTVLPDPTIASITPSVPEQGEPIIITGTGFTPHSKVKLKFTGTSIEVDTHYISPTQLFAKPPALTGPQTMTMLIEGRETATHPIEMTPTELPLFGLTINVNTTADTNTRDDKISLREAIMLAKGTLSLTDLTSPPDPRPSKVNYETDFIYGDQLGEAAKNTINGGSFDDVYTLSSPLPSFGSHDSIWGFTIDASAVSGTPLILDGTERADLSVTIRNSQEDSLLITGGANSNTIYLTSENSTRHGVYIKDSAHSNYLSASITEAGLYGVYLSGENVRANEIRNGSIVGPGLWGVVFDNGARFNSLSGFSTTPISGFSSGGIWIKGDTTRGNMIGAKTDSFVRGTSFLPIHSNGGPGILVESPETHIELVNVYGNEGHGIQIGGSTAEYSQVSVSRIGYIAADGTKNPNLGSGIYVQPNSKNILIGGGSGTFDNHINSIAGNSGNGILIEGPGLENIELNRTGIGFAFNNDNEVINMGNDGHGIALMKGATNVSIGSTGYGSQVMITNQTNGAGLYIHGSNTTGNSVTGCRFGFATTFEDDRGNGTALQITGGAYGNFVGTPNFYPNEFYYNDIGILLESGGNPNQTIPETGIPFTPGGANVITNNTIGQNGKENRVGIKLVQGAQMNRIGGTGPTDINSIYGNSEAGILIDGVTHSRPEFANRIIGNSFYGSGNDLSPAPDPRNGNIKGAAILLKNGTSNQIIGGLAPGEGNEITTGLIGIALEDANNNIIIGNDIGGSDFNAPDFGWFFEDQNKQAGIFLSNSHNNRIGPDNLIAGNGLLGNLTLGGVYLHNSNSNYVVGNTLGREAIDLTRPLGDTRENIPNGITLNQSANNIIGYPSADGGNTIGLSTAYGVHLTGNSTIGNTLENNYIGVDPLGNAHPNAGHGIYIEGSANSNTIDGNTIQDNGQDGIAISGVSSNRNTITFNSISGHNSGLGIRLTGSSNSSIAPPTLKSEDGVEISGTTASGIPNGSIVEFFYDPIDEGLVQLGSTTVLNEKFSFNAALAPGLRITATLTDLAGNTSQFSPVVTINPTYGSALDIRRTTEPPATRSVPASQLPIPVLPLSITAPPNMAVSIRSMTFTASGTIDETNELQGLALYRDSSGDGIITSEDILLSDIEPFTENNGSVTIHPEASIQAGTQEQWLLAAVLKFGSDSGANLKFELSSALKVESTTVLSGTPLAETGIYPAISDTVTITQAVDPYDTWRTQTFLGIDATNDLISGRNADPDKDGIPNLLEYAIGSDPHSPNQWNNAQISISDTHYVFLIPLTSSQIDSPLQVEISNNLITWTIANLTSDIFGYIEDLEGSKAVVKVPRPTDESIPVFIRLQNQGL